MKKWRIAQFHPEDRYEPDDEVADGIRSRISDINDKLKNTEPGLVNQMFLERRRLQIELSERLYGE